MSSPASAEDFRKPRRDGTAFKSPKLYRFEADPPAVEVVTGWPQVLGYRRTPRRGWRHTRPRIQVIPGDLAKRAVRLKEDPSSSRRAMCLLRWNALIPQGIRARVARYIPLDRHFHVLSLFARSSDGGQNLDAPVELADSSPALLFALANSWVFKNSPVARPHRSLRALFCRRTQAEMLTWLDFPAAADAGSSSANVAHIFRRIVPSSVTLSRLLYLRGTLLDGTQETVKRLMFLDRLNAGAIRLLTDEEMSDVPHRLLMEIAHSKTNDMKPESAWLYRDCRLMCINMNRPVIRPRDIIELTAGHNELVDQFNRNRARRAPSENLLFPPPPVAGNDIIRPILNSGDLEREGIEMHHCVGVYVPRVVARQSFIYSVRTTKERATLELMPRGRRWVMRQLVTFHNKRVRLATRNAVIKWLESSAAPDATHPE